MSEESALSSLICFKIENDMTFLSKFEELLTHSERGFCGKHDPALVAASIEDVETRLRCLTLGTILGSSYIGPKRWEKIVSLQGDWLLTPSQVAYKTSSQVLQHMQQNGLAPARHIARVWWQICRGVQGRFMGSILDLIHTEADNATRLQDYLANSKTTFPVLSGPVISARWLDWVHRIGAVSLENWERLRVHLTPQQLKKARALGIPDIEAHPIFALALELWTEDCKKGEEDIWNWKDQPKQSR